MNDATSWSNPVRARLQAGLPVFGVTITTSSVEIAAHAATIGFHFLWVEMEHSPITLETLRLMVLATVGKPAAIFARVPVNELWTAKRVLDQGVHGVIFPFTTTPEKAARAAAGTHYPPAGLRGSGAGAAMRTWPGAGSYPDSCDREVFTVCVIEEAAAVEQIDAIAATPGIDALFIGVSDLSFSLGLRNRQDVPVFEDAIKRIVDAAKRHGKFVGRPARTAEQARQYMEQGFLFFQAPTEIGLIEMGAKQLLGGIENATKALY